MVSLQHNGQAPRCGYLQTAEEIDIFTAATALAPNPYDRAHAHDTLIDPYVRKKREFCMLTEAPLDFYVNGGITDIGKMFANDFRLWNETHFYCLGKKGCGQIERLLLEKGVNIKTRPGFPVRKGLSEFDQQ